MRARFCLLLALFAAPAALSAATLLVYVEESSDGVTVPRAHPVRDALIGAFFDRGHIVFDPGESTVADVDWSDGSSETLWGFAFRGGAQYYLSVRSATTTTRRTETRPTVEVSLRYALRRTESGSEESLGEGTLSVSNSGAEDRVDATGVAAGAADALAEAVERLLLAPPAESTSR